MSDQPIVELEGVFKRYQTGQPDPPWVLRDVSLRVGAGESLAVVGPSGSGKSTLLNLIGALDTPTRGSVRLEGQDLSALDARGLASLRNRKVGFVFQLHHLLPQCTVLENVLVPTLVNGRGDDPEARAVELLQRVGLREVLSHRPGQLSGGQRQRVAVVRALINRPRLLLADEPTGSLDRTAAEGLADLLVELNRRDGVTLLVATHATDLAGRMRHVLHLRDGRLAEGPVRP